MSLSSGGGNLPDFGFIVDGTFASDSDRQKRALLYASRMGYLCLAILGTTLNELVGDGNQIPSIELFYPLVVKDCIFASMLLTIVEQRQTDTDFNLSEFFSDAFHGRCEGIRQTFYDYYQ